MRSLPTNDELDAPLFNPPMIYRYMRPQSYLPSTPAGRSHLPGSPLATESLQVADSPMSDVSATAGADEQDSSAMIPDIESLEVSDGESSSGSQPGRHSNFSADGISMSMGLSEDAILLGTPAVLKFQVKLPCFENLVRCIPSSARHPWHRVHELRGLYLKRLKNYQTSKEENTSALAGRNAKAKADAAQRKYIRMTERQRLLLDMVFDEITPHPCMTWREVLVCVLDVTPDRLDHWFQRRRYSAKLAEEALVEPNDRHSKTRGMRASAPPGCSLTITPDDERMPLRNSALKLKLKLSPQARDQDVYAEIEERGGWWSTEMFTDLVLYAWSILHLDPWASSGRG